MKKHYFDTMFAQLERVSEITITDEEKNKIQNKLNYLKLSKKSFFIKEGEVVNKRAFVVSGILRSYYIDGEGNEITKCFVFENNLISYASSEINKGSNNFIEALEDCELLILDCNSFDEVTSDSILWLRAISKIQENIIQFREQRERSFLTESAKERYLKFIEEHPGIDKRINHSFIASYLGITPVSLSRIRSNLKASNN
ncbi:MAG: Crp/Fnr family transcriptional regulator [Clostridiaceae bacterium]